jgi:hypothetical protein
MKPTILTFGKYKGQTLEEVPDLYLQFLGKPVYSGHYYKSLHSTELNWKVPWSVTVAARQILEARGYKLKGTRWEK